MSDQVLILNGENLTVEEVDRVARQGVKIEIALEAMNRLEKARELVFELADKGIPIYGFTVGVGWNKDKEVFDEYFEEYNRNLIYAHCVAVGPEASEEDVRAILLARLNTLLVGRTGIQPAVAYMYKEFLNHGIHPVIPERGSVGQADISCLSHIGLAIMGEGEVFYGGERMDTSKAMEMAGIKPVVLGPKDGLAIVSSSALSAGKAALVLNDIKELIDMANLIYAMSLEGLDGNVTPLDPIVNEIRKMPGQIYCAESIRKYLKGSYLNSKDITKSLQDPLSYRDACAVHGSVRDALEYVRKYLELQLNTSDDNPCVVIEERKIISCQNFEVTTWAVGFEMLAIALSHLSKMSCHRTVKLSNPSFSGLSRFLSPNEGEVQAYQTIQKPFTSLDTEIRHLANPSSMDFFSVAGEIEDHANNTPHVVRRVAKIVDNLYYVLGIELLHAAQAIDLRKPDSLGKATKAVFDEFRNEITFLEKDRCLTIDIKKAYDIIKSGNLLKAAREALA
ncbi:HAL/PAL/TAL family ammonia-lyase [Wukongibacter sp. M2B1]|uniref:HAL/PAL/TAL family ammonia-lyase n=1 Tax=Wukongibacter sp. M2B1 TaxID=3088895 RepID=UPI003D78BCC3